MISTIWKEAASMIAAIWIGLIIGVSFYAAPIKFAVKDQVQFNDLLLVGQATFGGFTWVECTSFLLLLIASLYYLNKRVIWTGLLLLLFLVIQKFIILPRFDEILVQVIEGEAKKDYELHYIYGALDLMKIGALSTLFFMFRSGQRPTPVG